MRSTGLVSRWRCCRPRYEVSRTRRTCTCRAPNFTSCWRSHSTGREFPTVRQCTIARLCRRGAGLTRCSISAGNARPRGSRRTSDQRPANSDRLPGADVQAVEARLDQACSAHPPVRARAVTDFFALMAAPPHGRAKPRCLLQLRASRDTIGRSRCFGPDVPRALDGRGIRSSARCCGNCEPARIFARSSAQSHIVFHEV